MTEKQFDGESDMKIFSCRQKGCGPRSGRAAIVPFALALALFSVYSCRHAVNYDVLDAEAASAVSEQGFEVSARFLSAPGEIMDIFHAFLPDSNVVPVKVSVRNNFVVATKLMIFIFQSIVAMGT